MTHNASHERYFDESNLPVRVRVFLLGDGRRGIKPSNIDEGTEWFKKRASLVTALTKRGATIAIYGDSGRGKTVMACSAAMLLQNPLTHEPMPFVYVTLIDLMLELEQASYRNSGTSRAEVLQTYRKPSLLIIDECGKGAGTDSEIRIFFSLMSARYNDIKNTILISNHSEAEFKSWLGGSLMDRLNETGGFMNCNWPSFRS